MLKIDGDKTQLLHEASSREWLETNGIGGFSSGTVAGIHSRRYHGLLTAALEPPLGRFLLLSKFIESVFIGAKRYELSPNRFPGGVFPQDHLLPKSFRLDPFPIWEYEFGGLVLERSLFMPWGSNAVAISWRVSEGSDEVSLEVRPFVAFRDYHHLGAGSDDFLTESGSPEEVSVLRKAMDVRLHFSQNAVEMEPTGHWYEDFEYDIEAERGFDFRENLFQPFKLRFDLGEAATLIASTEPSDWRRFPSLAAGEKDRRETLVEDSGCEDAFEKALVCASDQFIVRRGDGMSVIAGYPWFSDWGRDTMIALPGLALATRRFGVAKEVLVEFSKHVSQGMIPNRFPDAGDEPEYNTVDASLWFFEAVRAYIDASGDGSIIDRDFYDKLADIISWHLRGTRHNIHVDTDGLLECGEAGTQLTWMDAKQGDTVFTPRIGKPVEIQALWYNALRVMETLARSRNDLKRADICRTVASQAKQSFNALFWNEEDGCLFDVVLDDFKDRTVRPNQVLAGSLHHPILEDPERMKQIVAKIERELLTPFGLRSLTPSDPRYRGVYTGSSYDRDASYHQGTVWAWLTGPFIDALVRAFPERIDEVDGLLHGFRNHLEEAGIGQISEIFDGDAPHAPRGCPAQAWSVAEILRVLKRYTRPIK